MHVVSIFLLYYKNKKKRNLLFIVENDKMEKRNKKEVKIWKK